MSSTTSPTPGPFSGLKVIDLTRVLAGPYCTMLLADFGADVIKVEMPVRGDDARHIGPFIEEKSTYFMSLNRGKRSIALDLKDDADRSTFEALLETADVVVENYRPGTFDKMDMTGSLSIKGSPPLSWRPPAVSGRPALTASDLHMTWSSRPWAAL